ncbi:prepilin-type N-terminal cleavage/methylation domain-containing protein [Variovorax paradoxus]|nr:prepilin-type N-terminal cleavage/methylation domain-containing protein [Variovorax paradoxus]
MRKSKGFTLIELLVAIAVMALLAVMSWRGLEGMTRAQALNRERGDAMLTLQAALSQWNADLDATTALAQTRPMDWDGRVLRLTRRSTDSALSVVYVVAWTLRADAAVGARWQRWQSPGITTRAEWQQAWDRAAAWGQDGGTGNNELRGAELGLMPVEAWQIYYFRNDTWSPAVGADALGTGTPPPLPDGVRLVLSLPPGAALAGLLIRDWVRPTATVPKTS